MTATGHAPGPLLLLGAATCAIAFSTNHPVLVTALAVGSVLLLAAAPPPRRLVLTVAAFVAVGVAVMNPFVQANGDLILVQLPDIPIFDTQVTLEEVVAGLVLGMRAAAVTIIVMAVLALADPDRLLALAGRLLPNSALAASIAARLVPTMRRDAQALVETARLRGRSPVAGSWRTRAVNAGALAVPLVGSALDRSVDVAEAMAARGYGPGPRTRTPAPARSRADRVVLAVALLLCPVAALAVSGRVGGYDFYPTLGPVGGTADLAAAAVCLAGLGICALELRRR